MANANYIDIIRGQEAICPQGLGRVTDWFFSLDESAVQSWVEIVPYVKHEKNRWPVDDVELINPR